jgi:putative CocE/NonD family hydrolase
VICEKDVYVSMRDGVGLAVDLYRPDSLATHAALLTITPYRKDSTAVVAGEPLDALGRRVATAGVADSDPAVESMALAAAPFVDAGFVVAVADARGTGYSEGVYDYYNLDGGRFDGYDLVEWLAAQPWCTGKVGIMGGSAHAVYAYLTALTAPPHLVAMSAYAHPGDFYFDQWRIGGVLRWENRIGWAHGMRAMTEPIDPGDPASPGYERKRAVYASRFRRLGERISRGLGAVDLDWLTEMYHRPAYDRFWQDRSILRRAAEITIPVLHGGVWFDHFIRGTVRSHEAVDVPKMLIVDPGSLATRPASASEMTSLAVEWFEHFLAGSENRILERPSARLYLMGLEAYVDEPTWPVPAVATEFFLRTGSSGSSSSLNDGRLSLAPAGDDEPSDLLRHDPTRPNLTPRDVVDQRDFETSCLTYTSEPLPSDLTVIGESRLILYAVTDAADVDWCVRLCDVDEAGRSRLLNTGALKGSHVESHEHPAPLVAGRIYRFEIEVWPIANLFRAGHRIRVVLSTSDYPFFEINGEPSENRILHDPRHRSRIVLPVTG